jgi:hypothetical protein
VKRSDICNLMSRRRQVFLSTVCLLLLLQSHASHGQSPAKMGSWSGVISLQVNPIAAALLPNGKVLTWSSDAQLTFGGDNGDNPDQTYTDLFDPNARSEVVTIETSGLSDMFCPGIARLPDGKVLVNGGSSSPKTTIYDPVKNTWSASGLMNVPRGYNGDVLLQTGDVFTLGGSWSGGPGVDKIGEVWSQGGWTARTGISAEPIATDASGIPLDPADQTNPQPPWRNSIYRSDKERSSTLIPGCLKREFVIMSGCLLQATGGSFTPDPAPRCIGSLPQEVAQ